MFNYLIKQQIENASADLKNKFKLLIQGEKLIEDIDEHLVFSDLDRNQGSVWSLLLLT